MVRQHCHYHHHPPRYFRPPAAPAERAAPAGPLTAATTSTTTKRCLTRGNLPQERNRTLPTHVFLCFAIGPDLVNLLPQWHLSSNLSVSSPEESSLLVPEDSAAEVSVPVSASSTFRLFVSCPPRLRVVIRRQTTRRATREQQAYLPSKAGDPAYSGPPAETPGSSNSNRRSRRGKPGAHAGLRRTRGWNLVFSLEVVLETGIPSSCLFLLMFLLLQISGNEINFNIKGEGDLQERVKCGAKYSANAEGNNEKR